MLPSGRAQWRQYSRDTSPSAKSAGSRIVIPQAMQDLVDSVGSFIDVISISLREKQAKEVLDQGRSVPVEDRVIGGEQVSVEKVVVDESDPGVEHKVWSEKLHAAFDGRFLQGPSEMERGRGVDGGQDVPRCPGKAGGVGDKASVEPFLRP